MRENLQDNVYILYSVIITLLSITLILVLNWIKDLVSIWSIDINQNFQLIPYLTIVQRVVRFQYIWEILFILVATI